MTHLMPPPAEPVRLQRASGRALAEVKFEDGRTRLQRLHQGGCLKLRLPRLPQTGLEAVAINTAGGLTGGDRLAQRFEVGEGASLTVTTQAAERVYRASAGRAEFTTEAQVAPGGAFAFLPQETILFDGGALRRRLDVEASATSRLVLCESVILGRTLMGERVRQGLLHDSWRIRRGGALVHAEELRIEGDVEAMVAARAGLAGNLAFATVLAQAPEAEGLLSEVRALLGEAGGASLVCGFLLVRLVAANGLALRRRLVPVLSLLAGVPLPRVWSL